MYIFRILDLILSNVRHMSTQIIYMMLDHQTDPVTYLEEAWDERQY